LYAGACRCAFHHCRKIRTRGKAAAGPPGPVDYPPADPSTQRAGRDWASGRRKAARPRGSPVVSASGSVQITQGAVEGTPCAPVVLGQKIHTSVSHGSTLAGQLPFCTLLQLQAHRSSASLTSACCDLFVWGRTRTRRPARRIRRALESSASSSRRYHVTMGQHRPFGGFAARARARYTAPTDRPKPPSFDQSEDRGRMGWVAISATHTAAD